MPARRLAHAPALAACGLVLVLSACSDAGVPVPGAAAPARVSVEGDVLAFLSEIDGERVAGATVSVLERPELTMVTGADAHFRFDGLEEGSELTLVVEHPDFKSTQTATVTLGASGAYPFAIQVVPNGIFTALATLVPEPVDEDQFCVIATTVARLGGSLYVHLRQGVPGVAVALEPAVPAGSGPIYFDEDVLPSLVQPATSIDGGVLYYRVPPGDYTMRADKPGNVFNTVRFQCRAGMIVNAGPPLGLLANIPAPDYAAGRDLAADERTAATDALCQATSSCVNEEAGEERYPAATVASCRAMFRNMWASLDEACAASSGVVAAALGAYQCRASSCVETLGADDVCVPEDAAFRAAEAGYGACVAGDS
ncbi:MAG: carboxypeptidase-like regulatory domain-containing protein [Polyangiaceae bacterium]